MIKQTLCAALFGVFVVGSAQAANVFKFTFPDVAYPDGSLGTLRASVKLVKRDSVTVCGYFADPNDSFLGQFEGTDNRSADASVVLEYCLAHFNERHQ